MAASESPSKPEDLLHMMDLDAIGIAKMSDHPAGFDDTADEAADEPVAELVFHADFEQEHGVGILPDGVNVLGLDYAGESTPFVE